LIDVVRVRVDLLFELKGEGEGDEGADVEEDDFALLIGDERGVEGADKRADVDEYVDADAGDREVSSQEAIKLDNRVLSGHGHICPFTIDVPTDFLKRKNL